jgi:hypothetical protein
MERVLRDLKPEPQWKVRQRRKQFKADVAVIVISGCLTVLLLIFGKA